MGLLYHFPERGLKLLILYLKSDVETCGSPLPLPREGIETKCLPSLLVVIDQSPLPLPREGIETDTVGRLATM